MAIIAGARTFHQVRATIRAGFMPVMKISWITSPLALAFAQKFLPEETWVPFFNIIAFIIGTYINAHTKKKRIAPLRKKVIDIVLLNLQVELTHYSTTVNEAPAAGLMNTQDAIIKAMRRGEDGCACGCLCTWLGKFLAMVFIAISPVARYNPCMLLVLLVGRKSRSWLFLYVGYSPQ